MKFKFVSILHFAVRWFIRIMNLLKEGKRISLPKHKKMHRNPIISQNRIEIKIILEPKSNFMPIISPFFLPSLFLFSFPSFHYFIFFFFVSESLPPPFGGKKGGTYPRAPTGTCIILDYLQAFKLKPNKIRK